MPPCANDSGSAIGTAIDALHAHTGDPHIEWSVYAGLEFEWDAKPASERWTERKVDLMKLAEVLALRRGDRHKLLSLVLPHLRSFNLFY